MTALLDPVDGAPTAPVRAISTHLPTTDQSVRPVPRAALGGLPLESRFLTWGARLAALGTAWVITQRLLPWHGLGWFVVVFALADVVLLAVGTAIFDTNVAVSDRVARWVVSSAAVVVVFSLSLSLLAPSEPLSLLPQAARIRARPAATAPSRAALLVVRIPYPLRLRVGRSEKPRAPPTPMLAIHRAGDAPVSGSSPA